MVIHRALTSTKPKKSKLLKPLVIGGRKIYPGERAHISLDAASLYDFTKLSIPIEVIRGKEPGPTLFISAAIHGDEINGVEIIKRLLRKRYLKNIKGTLILVPIVNVFGFNNKSRYLPDRRDLNRSFPGSKTGSLASRLAHIFMNEIVKKCSHGIDLHTGAIHRNNYPQIRACLDDKDTKDLAQAFGVPVIIHSDVRDGSLREAARKRKIPTLVFEGGEALRFNEDVIKIGIKGCVSVMKKIGMLPPGKTIDRKRKPISIARDSFWVRAPHSGSFRTLKKLGDHIERGDTLAVVSDPFGRETHMVTAKEEGIVIGMATIPLVNKGDAMFHIATFQDLDRTTKMMDLLDREIL